MQILASGSRKLGAVIAKLTFAAIGFVNDIGAAALNGLKMRVSEVHGRMRRRPGTLGTFQRDMQLFDHASSPSCSPPIRQLAPTWIWHLLELMISRVVTQVSKTMPT